MTQLGHQQKDEMRPNVLIWPGLINIIESQNCHNIAFNIASTPYGNSSRRPDLKPAWHEPFKLG